MRTLIMRTIRKVDGAHMFVSKRSDLLELRRNSVANGASWMFGFGGRVCPAEILHRLNPITAHGYVRAVCQ